MGLAASSHDAVTALLVELQAGEGDAVQAQLYDLVYDELRRIARRQLRRERADHTMQTTDLVHEAYLKLVGQEVDWQNRAHFYAIASRAMRQVLVSYARARNAQKRGGNWQRLTLEERDLSVEEQAGVLVALDDALDHLAQRDERLAQVVEYRFFGGMTETEIGHVLGVSERTVRRDWVKARAWLLVMLDDRADGAGRADGTASAA